MPGKGAKERRHAKVMNAKRKKRDANRARYAVMRDQGVNTKSKRHTLGVRRGKKSLTRHRHLMSFCGNHGCKKCYERKTNFQRANPSLVDKRVHARNG